MDLLDNLLTSRSRAEILKLLFDGSNQALYMRDIEKRSGLAIRSVQQELEKLEKLQLVVSRRDGNRLYFSANQKHPIYSDLQNLVLKTSQWMHKLRAGLNIKNVEIAFIFGSIARREETAKSDIDLCIIGNIGLKQVSGIVRPIGRDIHREINPHTYTVDQLKKRIMSKEHFITQLMDSKKIFLKGSEDELKVMG